MYSQRVESPNSVCKPDLYGLHGLPRADESGSSKRSRATTISCSDVDENNENKSNSLVKLQNFIEKNHPNHSFDFSGSAIFVRDSDTAVIYCKKNNRDKHYIITRSGFIKSASQINFFRRTKIPNAILREVDFFSLDQEYQYLKMFSDLIQLNLSEVKQEMLKKNPTYCPLLNINKLNKELNDIRFLEEGQLNKEMNRLGIQSENDVAWFTKPKTQNNHLCNDHHVIFKGPDYQVFILMDGVGSCGHKSQSASRLKLAFDLSDGQLLFDTVIAHLRVGNTKAAVDELNCFIKSRLYSGHSTTVNMVFKLGSEVYKFSLGDTDDCYYFSCQDQVVGLDSRKTYWHDNEGYYSHSFSGACQPDLKCAFYQLSQGDLGFLMTDGVSKTMWNSFYADEIPGRPQLAEGNTVDPTMLRLISLAYGKNIKKIAVALRILNDHICPAVFPIDDASLILFKV